jgi:thioredoxin-like negative regulator of GroEL
MIVARIVLLGWLIPSVVSWLARPTPWTRMTTNKVTSLAATLVIGTNTTAVSLDNEVPTRTPLVKLDDLQRKSTSRSDQLKEKEFTTGTVWSLHTRDSFCQAIDAQSHTHQLTVIKFHAHYCKTCQRMSIPFKQLSKTYEHIQFVRLEATEDFSSEQLRSLGVTSFPFLQIYRGSHCVASFAGGGPYFRRKLQDTLEECLKRDDWEAFYEEYRSYIEENAQACAGLIKAS